MPDDAGQADLRILAALDAATGRLWPNLRADERREKALEAFGLKPIAEWRGRMVYIEDRSRG